MSRYQLLGHPPVPLILRRSAQARRISLRISQLDGRVTLTLPKHVPEREALDFARSKEGWIRSHLERRAPIQQVALGTELPLEGEMVRLERTQGRRILRASGQLFVPEDAVARRVQRFLKELARDRLVAASDFYAERLGRSYDRISLRDTRSRWGSCTADGGLMYSWRLILAPTDVLRYVAAHEVAHLAEMNHSAEFWTAVENIHGPCDVQRRWLREHGAELHRYRFDESTG